MSHSAMYTNYAMEHVKWIISLHIHGMASCLQVMEACNLDDYPGYREGFFDDEQGFGSKECLEDTEMNCLGH